MQKYRIEFSPIIAQILSFSLSLERFYTLYNYIFTTIHQIRQLLEKEMEKSRYKSSEEFQEEEIWGVDNQTRDSDSWTTAGNSSFKVDTKRVAAANRMNMMIPKSDKNLPESRIMSAPVNIPADWSKISSKKPCSWLDDDDDDESDEEEKGNDRSSVIPPHEVIAKNQISSFSVFEGVGRTLKGRDLSRVRHAVLTKTGFLESKSHHYPL